jgi:phosphoesterase RecJ-like protein
MKTPHKLKKTIRENRTFLIVTHINPEGDAIGSCISLALGLKKLGKRVSLFGRDSLPSDLKFLPHSHLYTTKIPAIKFDVICVVDCNTIERTGLKGLGAKNTIIIDHHIPSPLTTHQMFHSDSLTCFIDEHASAAGELVYKVLRSLHVPLDAEIATNLYTAIYTDTGGFRYSNTNPESLQICSTLIKEGADPWDITSKLYESLPMNRLRLLALILTTLEKKDAIAWVTIHRDMYRKTQTSVEDSENMVDYPRAIDGVEMAVLFREDKKNVYKVSLRSKGSVNVADIARSFGGGGHAKAAGCRLNGSLAEVKKRVLSASRTAIRKSRK